LLKFSIRWRQPPSHGPVTLVASRKNREIVIFYYSVCADAIDAVVRPYSIHGVNSDAMRMMWSSQSQ